MTARRMALCEQTAAREARELRTMHDERDRRDGLDGGRFEVRSSRFSELRTPNLGLRNSRQSRALSGVPTELFRPVAFDFRWVHF